MKKILYFCAAVLFLSACGGQEASMFSKAQRLTNKGEFQKAIQIYSQIIKNNPESYGAYASRGLLYERLIPKDAEELQKNRRYAEKDYERALELNFKSPEVFNNLAALYIDEGRNTDAILHLNQALYYRPDYALALINRGVAKSKRGEIASALIDFDAAEKLDKNSALLYLNRGLAFLENGYYASAADDFAYLTELQPQNARAYFERGRAFIKMEYYQNAMDDFQIAMAIRPDYPMPYYYAAQLLFARGNIDEAIAYAQQAKELASNYAPVYDLLGDMLALASPVEATQHYLAARRLDPKHATKYQQKIKMMTTEQGRRKVVTDRLVDIEKH